MCVEFCKGGKRSKAISTTVNYIVIESYARGFPIIMIVKQGTGDEKDGSWSFHGIKCVTTMRRENINFTH